MSAYTNCLSITYYMLHCFLSSFYDCWLSHRWSLLRVKLVAVLCSDDVVVDIVRNLIPWYTVLYSFAWDFQISEYCGHMIMQRNISWRSSLIIKEHNFVAPCFVYWPNAMQPFHNNWMYKWLYHYSVKCTQWMKYYTHLVYCYGHISKWTNFS